jgi:predicted metal-dependent hydrolase
LELLATGESLQVVYTPSAHKRIALHYVANATLTLSCAISAPADCQQALRHWLRGYAQVQLSQWLQALAAETGLQYGSCRVKGQQTRWGLKQLPQNPLKAIHNYPFWIALKKATDRLSVNSSSKNTGD